MKKLTLLLILLIGSLSYSQDKPTVIYAYPPDRQKIAFDTITGDISLQNSPSINIGPYVKANATIPIIFEDASNKTIGPDDNSKFFLNRTNNEYTYIVQNQANGGYDNSTLAFTFGVDSTLAGYTGKIFVKGETGSGVMPMEISVPGKPSALIRKGPNDWVWSVGAAISWDGLDNIYTSAGSINLPDETSLTGWAAGDAVLVLNTDSEGIKTGTTSLSVTDNNGTTSASNRRYTNPMKPLGGQVITFSFWQKGPVGTDMGIRLGNPLISVSNLACNGDWQYREMQVTADGTDIFAYIYINHVGLTTPTTGFVDDIKLTYE